MAHKGDRNSRYFQQRANICRKKKLVHKLKHECGQWLDNQQDITSKFISDYTTRFKTARTLHQDFSRIQVTSKVSQIDNIMLTRIPYMIEVKDALLTIDSIKTQGPDGFGAGFFKHYWDIIKTDFYQCVAEFFKHGKLLKQINHTFITLITKRDNPFKTHHYRPISLCNTVYKTISKIIVNRLRPLLDNLISPLQSAFIPG